MNKNIFKVITGLLLVVILTITGILGYSLIFEKESIKIDEYNFNQLESVDKIIMNDQKYDYVFKNLGDFNKIYNSNIKPIKNCYYINKYNGDEKYIFGFRLESYLYKIRYMNNYIAYPKYDLSKELYCGGGKDCKDDLDFYSFEKIISNPCNGD